MRFAQLFQEFRQQWTFEGLFVADGARYSADNLNAMTGLRWLTRVPLSIKATAILVDEVVELTPSIIKGYSLKESLSDYAGIEQRWILVENEQRRKSDLKQLATKIEQYQQKRVHKTSWVDGFTTIDSDNRSHDTAINP